MFTSLLNGLARQGSIATSLICTVVRGVGKRRAPEFARPPEHRHECQRDRLLTSWAASDGLSVPEYREHLHGVWRRLESPRGL